MSTYYIDDVLKRQKGSFGGKGEMKVPTAGITENLLIRQHAPRSMRKRARIARARTRATHNTTKLQLSRHVPFYATVSSRAIVSFSIVLGIQAPNTTYTGSVEINKYLPT